MAARSLTPAAPVVVIPKEVPSKSAPVSPRWHRCAIELLRLSGKTGKGSAGLPGLYQRHSVSKNEDFLELMMAVIYTESRFNRDAVSSAEAYGLMQLTAEAVVDASKDCRLQPIHSMTELHDSATNVRYGSCYLRKLLRETEGNLDRALIIYNGGYRQLMRYDAGQPVVPETANYILLVHRALDLCQVL